MRQSEAAVDADYIHRFIPATKVHRPPLLLLHRTGGNESDLIEAGQRAGQGAALLAVRGNVLENGAPRFFRRHARGQFDLDDLKRRTDELADFIVWSRIKYGIPAPIAFGFSNGANIAWSLIFQRPEVLRGAVLMRPTLAYDPRPIRPLNGFPALVIAGQADKTILPERANDLPHLLAEAGADAVLRWVDVGHDISIDDEKIASEWIKGLLQR